MNMQAIMMQAKKMQKDIENSKFLTIKQQTKSSIPNADFCSRPRRYYSPRMCTEVLTKTRIILSGIKKFIPQLEAP